MKQTLVLFSALLIALPCAAQEPVTLDLDVDGLIVDAPGEYSLPEHSFGSVPVRDEGPAQVLLSIVLGTVVLNALQYPALPTEQPEFETRMVCPENGPFPFSHGPTLVEFPEWAYDCLTLDPTEEPDVHIEVYRSQMAYGEPYVVYRCDWPERR